MPVAKQAKDEKEWSHGDFSREELIHYSRHLLLADLGLEGQKRLKKASVLVVGAGGLGCPVLQYLSAAGVGHIGIADFDEVALSNLQRQVLFNVDDIGKSKAHIAAQRLSRLNPHIRFSIINQRIAAENATSILQPFDVICDCSDNFPTRYLLNDACVLLGRPNVYGAIHRFEGQITVFNQQHSDGNRGPQYRDIFPQPPSPEMAPNCAESGVLGVLPGIIGSLQASETIKIITGIGETLSGRLFVFDALTFETRTIKIKKNPLVAPTAILKDYEGFCEVDSAQALWEHTISAHQLKSLMDSGEPFRLIDVREPFEYEIANLGGLLIPMGELEERINEVPTNEKLVVMCKSGVRSAKACHLMHQMGWRNIFNLEGGILGWADVAGN
jgi:molybdopterin/thiamine biosynthesis adenylyltransferase/rhodanese-related sulfurtransferase